jgi:hypothetical protein
MGIKEQMAGDLPGVFFSEQDFAEPAVYRPASGPDFALSVLFDDPYHQVEPGGLGAIQAQDIRVQAATAAFPQPPGPGDTINIRGKDYRVATAEPDGVGVTGLCLHEVD